MNAFYGSCSQGWDLVAPKSARAVKTVGIRHRATRYALGKGWMPAK